MIQMQYFYDNQDPNIQSKGRLLVAQGIGV